MLVIDDELVACCFDEEHAIAHVGYGRKPYKIRDNLIGDNFRDEIITGDETI
jgi:hypothetical protein